MNPAPSVIIFTVLSGLGFGFLAYLGAVSRPEGWAAFWQWGLGYGFAVVGLISSIFHLGNPQRALLAFTQWRSSWLSREAWASVVTLLVLAPVALSDWLGLGWPRGIGFVGAGLAGGTVLATSMIYTQIRAVPRWHHPSVPLVFLAFALAGGAILGLRSADAIYPLALLGGAMLWHWGAGDGAFQRAGSRLETATGLGRIGTAQVFELPHTGGNYLLHEMIHIVGRKHRQKLRIIALGLAVGAPAVVLALAGGWVAAFVALALHLVGAFAQRWLFFAEAEHVVGLYYGRR